jgi:hypothetical protein
MKQRVKLSQRKIDFTSALVPEHSYIDEYHKSSEY